MLSFLVVLFPASLFAQSEFGTITGTVIESWEGKPLPNVTVTLRGTTLAATSDAQGRFQLNQAPPGEHTLRFSKSGYAAAVVTDVRVLAGQSSKVDGVLRPEFFEMEEYEVTAEEFQEQAVQLLQDRQQSGSLLDAIGSEQFSKMGAADAGQIVSRVTGVSLVGGKYAVVRGLSDRYTRTLLNGLEVPSADPYRMAPQLDLFPSGMIDKISVSKTFTPDQPGGTGGGTIDIITKPFPERPFVKASVGTSFNPSSNLKKNFLSDPNASLDILALPSGPEPLDPEFFKLNAAPLIPGPASSRETAVRAQERRALADGEAALLQGLGTADFAGVEQTSPLNSSLSASAGKTTPLFGRPLGMFAAMNYNRTFRLLEDYAVGDYSGVLTLKKSGRETRSNINTDYGANVNLGYELSDRAQFGFNFMLAHGIDEEARHSRFDHLEGREGDALEKWQLHHTEREIRNYQVHGHHDLDALADSKLDWTVGMAETTQDEPNHRFFNYFVDPTGRPTVGDSALPVPQNPSRYFREIEEQSLNSKADWTLPLSFLKEESKLKIGFFNSSADRDFREQYFGYAGGENFDSQNPNGYLNDAAFLQYAASYLGGIRTNYSFPRTIGLVIGRPYTASQDITAGYPMLDLGIFRWLRVIGGVRVERTLMDIQAQAGSATVDQLDLLPAASGVISFTTNILLRLGYAGTLARPSFREMAPISNYLPDVDLTADGNPDLRMSTITSYDARVEWFPTPGELLSAGVFYKELKHPIELYRLDFADSITWVNREKANVMGVEFEARKSLEALTEHLKGLTLGANIALIQSETAFTANEYQFKTNSAYHTGLNRPLFDQSPYIINLDLGYERPASGTSITLAANLTGERIVLTTAQGPDIYEHPPVTLDLVIGQKLGKHWSLRLGVKNLLDPEYLQTFGEDAQSAVRQAYKRGRTFSVSMTAEF